MSECALLIFISLRGVVIFFFSQVNCADFHRGGRTCFIPKLLNCSKYAVVQSFEFKGELVKKNKSLVSRGTKQRTTGSPGGQKK